MPQTTTPKKGVWKPIFLEKLREHANVSRAAREADINRKTAYHERAVSETFRKDWEDAIEEGLDNLEEEARRRAYEGVDEPVYYQGMRVGTVRKYSDTLTIFLLKGGRPEKYAERNRHEHTGAGGGPVKSEVNDTTPADKKAAGFAELFATLDELRAQSDETDGGPDSEEPLHPGDAEPGTA